MVETTPRVVVLARPGKAADNLAEALRQAGADLVAVADPSGLDQAALLAHRPQAVLVALEPGIEAAVDALDDVLSSPDLTVIFDEADTAAQRAGWDAARWVRHLSAKLHRHQDVLPPGAEPEADMVPTPGQPPTPASIHAAGLDMAPFAREAEGRAGGVPVDELRQERAAPALPDSGLSSTPAPAALALDDDAFFLETLSAGATVRDAGADMGGLGLVLDAPAEEESEGDGLAISAVQLGNEDASGFAEEIDAGELNEEELRAFEQAMRGSARAADDAVLDEEPPAFDPALLQDLGIDPALLEPIQPDVPEAPSTVAAEPLHDFDFARLDPPVSAPPAAEPVQARSAPAVDLPDFSSLSLADDDAGPLQPSPAATPARRHDLSELEQRISGLSLVDIEPSDEDDRDATPPPQAAPAPPVELREQAQAHSPLTPPPVAPEYDRPSESPAFAAYAPLPTSPAPVSPAPVAPPPIAAPAVMPPPLPGYAPPPAAAAPAAPVPAASAQAVRALVLVEAGLGGPDPVRQLLAGLPAGFGVPVVVRLQLQGGRYDRLVAQMERAASLPVSLAQPDQPLAPGRIHFLPDGVGMRRDGGGLRFDVAFAGQDSLYQTLETLEDGALVFLSGSDPGLVDRAVSLAASGAVVLAQAPEDCYDGVACAQLRARGVPAAAAPELAARLAEHWPH